MAASDSEEVASLIAQIAVAFHDVIRGEGTSLHETNVLDDYGSDEARLEARGWDTDTHWWDISEETLSGGSFYLGYLDAQGLRYYLPAWMTHSLKILHAPRTGYADTRRQTLNLLCHFDLPSSADYRRDQWKLLTLEQSRVICLYLRYVASHIESKYEVQRARKGLEQHWGQFCENSLSE